MVLIHVGGVFLPELQIDSNGFRFYKNGTGSDLLPKFILESEIDIFLSTFQTRYFILHSSFSFRSYSYFKFKISEENK